MARNEVVVRFLGDAASLDKAFDAAEKKTSGFGAKTEKAFAGVGVAAGAAMAVGVASSMNMEAANDKLAAQLGLGADAAGRIGKIAADLYKDNFGDSLAGVNDILRTTFQDGLVPMDATNAQIEEVASNLSNMAAAFDQESAAVSRAVSTMVKTGMADSTAEAFDILTVGFQNGNDKAGDLLDTMNEYSTLFRNMGIDGQQAMGLMSQGLQAGARDADKVADAVKEFSIRAIDGSKLSGEGFKLLGLDAEKMAKQIAAGGDGAAAGLGLTLDKLREMKNPVKRAEAAVALFGTQAEDLGEALFALDPATSAAALGVDDVAGAAKAMGDTLNDNATSRFESFKRTVEVSLGGVAEKFGPVLSLAPSIASFGVAAQVMGVNVAGAGQKVAAFGIKWTVAAAKAVAAGVLIIGQWVLQAAAAVVNAAIIAGAWLLAFWPVALVVAAVALAAYLIIRNWDTIKAAALAVWEFVRDKFTALVGFIQGLPSKIASAARGLFDGIKSAFRSALNWIIDKWNGLSFKLPSFSAFGKTIGGATLSTPNIPRFHSGGTFRAPTPGGEGLALLRDREEVLTPGQAAAGGGLTVVVQTGQTLATDRDIEDAVRRAIEGLLGRGGKIGDGRGNYLQMA